MWPVTGHLSFVLWLFEMRRLIREIKPDVVHAHYVGVPAYLVASSGFRPLSLAAIGSDILTDLTRNPVRKLLTACALRKADLVIAVSNTIREETIRLGASPDKVHVTPIGVDTSVFRPEKRNEDLKRSVIEDASPLIISTRNLKKVYDVETLVRAIPLVLAEVQHAGFVVVGEGEQRTFLEGLASNLGIEGRTRFIGSISTDKMPSYLASADLYVSTSLSDGTSISLLEALSSGLPVVVSDIPANRPWVEEGRNGFMFGPGDHRILAAKIIALINDPPLRSAMGSLSRDIAVSRADYETEMAKVERLYYELISSRNARAP